MKKQLLLVLALVGFGAISAETFTVFSPLMKNCAVRCNKKGGRWTVVYTKANGGQCTCKK